jgi:putative ATPase
VPIHLRNAPTGFAKGLGHGKGYQYPHDHPLAFVPQAYLPPEIEDLVLHRPHEIVEERETAKRAAWWRKMRAGGERPHPEEPR